MDADELLDLFDRLVAETVEALGALDDWGLSGLRETQYRHDVVADEIIAGGLRAAGLGVLSEESALARPAGDGDGVTVVVDPVDGSTNASLGLPWFAASLCAVDAEGPLAALVVNLASGLRYRAVRGRGARRDRSPLSIGGSAADDHGDPQPGSGAARTSGAQLATDGRVVGGGPIGRGPIGRSFADADVIGPSGCERLSDAIVAFSGPPPAPGGFRQFRVLGAAALDLCAVADGTLDGYADIDRAHGVWDYLGALLVCREVGVDLVDWGGEEPVVLDPEARRGPVVAATVSLRDELVALVGSGSAATD
ncbi:MAG: inositol monophosphatase family protein [Actinomycetota bacterium]